MSKSSKSSDKVWLSLAFYVAYFTYFMSYAYEINYMVMYKCSYVLFFAALACSFTSVLFTSTIFEVLTMLLIFTKLAIENYIFLVFLAILKRPTSQFVRWFFFLRIVVTLLYLILFWQYMKYLKNEKEKKLEEMREIEAHVQQYNDKVQENERNRISNQTNPNQVSQNPEVIPPQVAPQVFYDPNQMNMNNGHYYQVAAPVGMPVNNPNMMYNPNVVYNPNVIYNPNMMNTQPQQAPVPLPIPTTVASITTPANSHPNNNGTRTQYPYVNTNVNGNNNVNAYGSSPHHHQ